MSNKQNNNGILFLPLCISVGISFGLMIGAVCKNIPIGLCIGTAFGATAGGILSAIVLSKNKKDTGTENKE